MLRNTFCHVPGITTAVEQQLWSTGIHSWDLAGGRTHAGVSPRHAHALDAEIPRSRERIDERDVGYFARLLPSAEHWRLFGEFRPSTAYLDIETTGLSPGDSHVTTIALYDGAGIRWYVRGRNLEEFAGDVARYDLLVTYNGKCFDLPFLRESLGLRLDQAHIDLRYVLRALGYTGGLKACERRLGLSRGELADVDGFLAVRLWHEYRRTGAEPALETLLAYNIEDVVNLEHLLVLAYNLKIRETPFSASHAIPIPVPPPAPFRPDTGLVRRLRGFGGW